MKIPSPNGEVCSTKKCFIEESTCWYETYDEDESYICHACFEVRCTYERAPLYGCAKCDAKKSLAWHENKGTGRKDICELCYRKDVAERKKPESGCVKCGKEESSAWCENKETGKLNTCHNCYQKDRAKRNTPPDGSDEVDLQRTVRSRALINKPIIYNESTEDVWIPWYVK